MNAQMRHGLSDYRERSYIRREREGYDERSHTCDVEGEA